MIIREVGKDTVTNEPWQIWNVFIDLLATENYQDLTPIQQIAHSAFWYDSEVQNGGHLQYFENRGTEKYQETMDALEKLSAAEQYKILAEAGAKWTSKARIAIESAEDYVNEELEAEFEDYDNSYYKCDPPINAFLEKYLAEHQNEFINIV